MKNRKLATSLLILAGLMIRPALAIAADPTCTITLGPRTACVTPTTTRQARADGGIIDIQLPSPNILGATLTGTAAANAFLGCGSSSTQTFHLEQEFEVAGPDSKATEVALTMESTLVGLVRAKHKAGASARVASAKICPVGWPDSPLVVVHPPFELGGAGGRLCNQRLSPIKIPAMPIGRYILVADFVLSSDASGVTDGHSAADFSPSTTLPADWVRARDPFQGVDKKDFGFKVILTAEPLGTGTGASASASTRAKDPGIARTSGGVPSTIAPRSAKSTTVTGLDRHSSRR